MWPKIESFFNIRPKSKRTWKPGRTGGRSPFLCPLLTSSAGTMIPSNHRWITHSLNLYPYLRKTYTTLIKYVAKRAVSRRLIKRTLRYFDQYPFYKTMVRNSYHEKMHSDSNFNLTLAWTLTLSPGERSFDHLFPSVTKNFNSWYTNLPYNIPCDLDSKSEITRCKISS